MGAPAANTLPSGLVTFVFTDIEASTQLLRRVGDRYPALLERHREILRAAWTACGGCEVNAAHMEQGRTLPVTDATDEARTVLVSVASTGHRPD